MFGGMVGAGSESMIPDASADNSNEVLSMDDFRKLFGENSAAKLAGDDGRKAIEIVRERASEWGINPDKIGIIGFSAGSGVALNVCFDHNDASKPNLVVPVYGSAFEENVPDDAAPLFVLAPEFDMNPQASTGLNLYEMWHKAQLPAELHYFHGTNHGFGIKDNGEPVNIWPYLLYNFINKVDFIDSKYIFKLQESLN